MSGQAPGQAAYAVKGWQLRLTFLLLSVAAAAAQVSLVAAGAGLAMAAEVTGLGVLAFISWLTYCALGGFR